MNSILKQRSSGKYDSYMMRGIVDSEVLRKQEASPASEAE